MSSVSSKSLSQSSHGALREAGVTRGHSCVLCRRRKIKCDGQRPCGNCQRSQTGCVAVEAVPRKKRTQADLATRLRRAEEALSKAGLKIEDDDDYSNITIADAKEKNKTVLIDPKKGASTIREYHTIEDGKLIVEKGQSRYIENSIWGHISSEVREDSVHLLQHDSYEEETEDNMSLTSDYSSIIFGHSGISNSLKFLHPPPVKIFRLWQVFLNNVNPLTKIVHAPTLQEHLIQAMGDLETVTANTEALMFAIYYSAIVSLDDGACQNILGDTRVATLSKYSAAVKQALANAKLLRTSSLMVLQALTLYLLSIRQFTDHDTLWVLAGVATKIGQRMGLHRESASASLSIFEAEYRRRLWWQILTLEGHSSFFSGSVTTAAIMASRPSRLLNVNDSDLSPSMKEHPIEQAPITEMLFCRTTHDLGQFMYPYLTGGDGSSVTAPHGAESLVLKLKALDDFESSLEQKFLRYCDPSVPLHFLALVATRSSLSKMRLRIYVIHRKANAPFHSQAEKDTTFTLSLKILELDNEAHSKESQAKLQRYLWHIRAFFQLEAFTYALSELRVRTTGPQVDRGWELIEAVYQHHEERLRDTKNKLWIAVGNLCLKAWEERAKALRNQHSTKTPRQPAYVRWLYAQRGIKDGIDTISGHANQAAMIMDSRLEPELPSMRNEQPFGVQWTDLEMPLAPAPFNFGGTPMDWEYWQNLSDDCGLSLFN